MRMLPGQHSNAGGAAQVGPVDIGTEAFAADYACGLALDGDAKAFTDLLPRRNRFPQVAKRCATSLRIRRLGRRRKPVEKGPK